MPHLGSVPGGASHEVGTYVTALTTENMQRGFSRNAFQTGLALARCSRIACSPSKCTCVGTTTGRSRSMPGAMSVPNGCARNRSRHSRSGSMGESAPIDREILGSTGGKGTRRHTPERPTRLITRRSQVHISPPLLMEVWTARSEPFSRLRVAPLHKVAWSNQQFDGWTAAFRRCRRCLLDAERDGSAVLSRCRRSGSRGHVRGR